MVITSPSVAVTLSKSRGEMLASRDFETQGASLEFATSEFAGDWSGKNPVQRLVWVHNLHARPLRLLQPIPVYIVQSEDGAVASFWTANIHASGETVSDALSSLITLIVDAYKMLLDHRKSLGPAPSVQLTVLEEFIKRPRR